MESERCASFSRALEDDKPVYVPIEATLADGLAVPEVGYNAFETAKHLIDKMVIVCSFFFTFSEPSNSCLLLKNGSSAICHFLISLK